jgi:predicted nucleic acid-binding protein
VIVVDASVLVDVLLRVPTAGPVESRLLDSDPTLHAPHLIDVEVLQVLRRFASAGGWRPARAAQALDDLAALPIERYPHDALAARIWELRRSLTAYDAAYIALAEALDCPLVTRDARLARSPGHTAIVEEL